MNKIIFLDQLIPEGIVYLINPYIYICDKFQESDIKLFLNRLDGYKSYAVSIELVFSWLLYDELFPAIMLSKPFLVTRNSNPKIIFEFIRDRLFELIDSYYLDDSIIQDLGPDRHTIILRYKEIILF
jgi:hypothetical protein